MVKLQSLTVRQPGMLVPDRMFCKMRLLDTNNNAIGIVANPYGLVTYSWNAKTPVGAQQYIGFISMVAFYRYYRIHASKIEVKFTNMEAFPVEVFVVPTNVSLTPVNQALLQEYVQNMGAKFKQLAPRGGIDSCTIKSFITTRKLVGSNSVKFDNTYASISTSTPGNVVFWQVGTYPTVGSNIYTVGNQVQIEVRLTGYCEFYERNVLTS